MKTLVIVILLFSSISFAQDFSQFKLDLQKHYNTTTENRTKLGFVNSINFLENELKYLLNSDSVLVDQYQSPNEVATLELYLLKICQTPTGKIICKGYLKKLKSLDSVDPRIQSHEIASRMFLALSQNQTLVDGWTFNHHSLIFIELQKFTETHLLRQLIHEIFQAIDYKNDIVKYQSQLGYTTNEVYCATKSLSQVYSVRSATSALRAFKVEDMILKELGIDSQMNQFAGLSCTQKIEILGVYFLELETIFPYDKIEFTASAYRCERQNLPLKRSEIESQLNEPYFIAPTSIETVCDFLINPDLNKLYLKYVPMTHQGPRPKIGDP